MSIRKKGVNFVKPSVKELRTTQMILAWFCLVTKLIFIWHTQRPLSQEKVTVWCAIGKRGIFGPYFFEDNDGNHVTVSAERYIEMMRRKFVPALRRKRGIDMNTVVFQHLNSSGSTSQGTDSSCIEPITPGHPIPQISTPWLSSVGVPERQNSWKQSTDNRGSERQHQNRNQTDSTRNAQ